MSNDLPTPDYARNMRIIAHCDQGGRLDGVQIMVHRGYAYIGHMFSKGLDMRDPAHPREAGRYWIPGMNAAAGETPSWPATRRYGLHHAIIDGDPASPVWPY